MLCVRDISRLRGESQYGCGRLGDCGRVTNRRQLDNPNPLRELRFQTRGDLQTESCLAHSADTGQGHQPVWLDCGLQLNDGHLAPNEARGGGPQVTRCGIERLERRELDAQAGSSDLKQLHWSWDVTESARPQRGQVRAAEQACGGAVEHDLAAVARGHHPRGAVENRAEVVPAAQFGFAGGDSHPHRQFECQLRCDRSIDSRTGRSKYGAHAVTCVVEHSSVVRVDGVTKNLIVSLQRDPHGGSICFPPTGRALDIGKEKCENAHGDLPTSSRSAWASSICSSAYVAMAALVMDSPLPANDS